MGKEQFKAILVLLVPQVIELITDYYKIDELTASKEFYASGVYAVLEQEDTKLWHLSALTLFHMYEEEKRTGFFEFPEEV